MATVQNIPTPSSTADLLDIVISNSGFQRAHIVGDSFSRSFTDRWFGNVLGPNLANEAINGVLLPEATRSVDPEMLEKMKAKTED